MYSFRNDYSEGAHPAILEKLAASNLEQTIGYGNDIYTQMAYDCIKKEIGREDVDIHLLVGGTQVNLTSISSFLRPHEAAIAAHTGHIFVHETGAIEATGHKVIAKQSQDGKVTPLMIQQVLENHTDEHMVKPKLVYISNATEIGTIYTKQELIKLSTICKQNHLLLYMDGARLGSALCAKGNDLTMQDLAQYTDAFYIGGTKNGALFGEALVIIKPELKQDFRYFIKQKGALLAKGRILGIQFATLFKDKLYYALADHANQMAQKLQDGIKKAGYDMMIDSPTNQIFPIFPKELVTKLQEHFQFEMWEKLDNNNDVIRLVTSWATEEKLVQSFIDFLSTCE